RKMLLAMGEDLRIIIVKLADRLHNMQTLKYLPLPKQKETALETREIFAPLAHRLGMWRLKWELEDLSFRYLDPDKFEEMRVKVVESRKQRELYVADFIQKIKEQLAKVVVDGDVYGRPKHFFSIYRKMVDQNLEFDELYDLLAVRIIVSTVKDCYAVLGIIHAVWKPIPGRFRDYIAMPKSNGYQSLHTTVIGVGGKPVEVQIRTKEMHSVAEYGIAAHWRYKEGETDKSLDLKMSWLRQMIEWQKDLKDAKDFMENFKIDLFTDEVFVFSPKGAVIDLPVDATPIDFAYQVHTEVGHRCVEEKINGRIVPLEHKLKNGDIVEIITGKLNNPSLDWLNIVKTSSARTKIKSYFKKQKREENIERGKKSIEEELRKLGLPIKNLMEGEAFERMLKEFRFGSPEEILVTVGYGELSPYQVAKFLGKHWQGKKDLSAGKKEPTEVKGRVRSKKKGQAVKVTGLDNVLVRFSKCCWPIPGDAVIGFVTKGRGVAVHRLDCLNVVNVAAGKEKKVQVEWDALMDQSYPVEIEVESFDRVGVFKDILAQIAETGTNVVSANVKSKRGSKAFISLVLDLKDTEHLARVLKSVRSVSDVYDAYRSDIARGKKRTVL
ncbi:MAG: bifunctional (p)ppGpp synthetase/guanosine-3',5'-bis(diphosphate) 3'-pyrophosphohydrolase, partial [Candidatus Saganbacteria bacterium]|nr:bifunctional (p)ppGpp synthetase/guanosine-3',5'-bis(diphosphate) 3'-pyrophosphohydrolase [Candidatus Saganbacteria bacterium]